MTALLRSASANWNTQLPLWASKRLELLRLSVNWAGSVQLTCTGLSPLRARGASGAVTVRGPAVAHAATSSMTQLRAPANKGLRFMALPRSGLRKEGDPQCDPDDGPEQLPMAIPSIGGGNEFTYVKSLPRA